MEDASNETIHPIGVTAQALDVDDDDDDDDDDSEASES